MASVGLDTGHGAVPVCEGRDAVHEDPESGEGVWGLHDTVEGKRHGEEEDDDGTGGFGVGEGGDGHVAECTGINEKLDTEKEDSSLGLGVGDADNCVEVTGEDDHTGDDHVGKFDDDLGDHEGLPRVSLAGTLSDLIQRSLGNEVGHNLEAKLVSFSFAHVGSVGHTC